MYHPLLKRDIEKSSFRVSTQQMHGHKEGRILWAWQTVILREQVSKVMQMRVNIEDLKLGPRVIEQLATEGEQSSLRSVFMFFFSRWISLLSGRYMLQLLTPASILGQSDWNGRCGWDERACPWCKDNHVNDFCNSMSQFTDPEHQWLVFREMYQRIYHILVVARTCANLLVCANTTKQIEWWHHPSARLEPCSSFPSPPIPSIQLSFKTNPPTCCNELIPAMLEPRSETLQSTLKHSKPRLDPRGWSSALRHMCRPSDSVRDSLHSLHMVTLCLRSIYTTLYIVVGSKLSPIVTLSWIPFVSSLSQCGTSSALSLGIRDYLGRTSKPLWLNKHPKSAFVELFHRQ